MSIKDQKLFRILAVALLAISVTMPVAQADDDGRQPNSLKEDAAKARRQPSVKRQSDGGADQDGESVY